MKSREKEGGKRHQSNNVREILAQIEPLQQRVDEARQQALADDGRIDDEEAAIISFLETRLGRAHQRLTAALERNPQLADQPVFSVETMTFEDDVVEGERTDEEMFVARRMMERNSIGNWRDNCKAEIDTLVNGMLDTQAIAARTSHAARSWGFSARP